MNHKDIAEEMKKSFIFQTPERKTEFFQGVKKKGLLNRQSHVISHKEFLAAQFLYIEKWTWVLSGFLLLFIAWICRRHSGNYPFALTPLLAAGILFETGRSRRWNMTELEQAARFSARSVMLARVFLLGAGNTAGLMIVIFAVRPFFSYSLIRVFLYMMVPYLTASLLGSLYERRYRGAPGWGSILVCILASAFFAAVSHFYNLLYEDRLVFFWASALILMICGLTVCIRRNICEREEPAWN